ncbi:MAG: hypothetical protein ACREJU_13885 [Nitrospiraceae bacterium]
MRPPRPKDPRHSAWPPSPRADRSPSPTASPRGGQGAAPPADQYGSFRASLLYCPKCRQATPTRERLLLVLPTGNLYEYLCTQCGSSTGSKTEKDHADVRLVIP